MQPLEYKNIGSEEHLTFDSIRRFVLSELSGLSEREARKHIDECHRCKGIHTSLAAPSEVRKGHSNRGNTLKMIAGVVAVVLIMILAGSFLYFGGTSKVASEKRADASSIADANELSEEYQGNEQAAPVMEAIDTLSQINDEPVIETPIAVNKQFDTYIETEQSVPRIKLRGIYGKITGNGRPLQGVTVMVPGSKRARVSDDGGKYYIQVPMNTSSLIFIYQGRQLVKRLESGSRRLDLHLKTENIDSPEPETQDAESTASID